MLHLRASPKSQEDCGKNKKELDCKGSFDRCATNSFDFKVGNKVTKSFTRTCKTKSSCDRATIQEKVCKAANEGICSLECCNKDLCNGVEKPVIGGASPVVSGILMVACALEAFSREWKPPWPVCAALES